MFDLKSAKIYRTVRLEKIVPVGLLRRAIAIGVVLVLILASLFILRVGFFERDVVFGWLLIVSSISLVLWIYVLFFESFLKKTDLPTDRDGNLAEFLDFPAAKVVDKFLKVPAKDLSALLKPILDIPGAAFAFFRLGFNPKKIDEELTNYLKQAPATYNRAELERFIEDTMSEIQQDGKKKAIGWRELLFMLSSHSEFLRKFLFDLHLEKGDLKAVCFWQGHLEERAEIRRKFWLRENLMRGKGIAKDWASGYTVNLDRFAFDITEDLGRQGFLPKLYGRTAETEAIERILARAGENNVVLVGEAGVGKRTIIYALARKIRDGETLPSLAHKRVLEMDVGALLAGAGSEHEVEGRIKLVLGEAVRAGNVILFVEDIQNLFQTTPAAGTINAAGLLLPYLSSNMLQVIGLCTYGGYMETIARNPSLLKAFEKVEVHETDKATVFQILRDVIPRIEAHSQVLITYQALKKVIELTDRYIKNIPFPEKAIDVLQEAAILARTKARTPKVTEQHIEEVVHQKTEIPVGKIALAEREVLLDLENILHRRVIGQDEAITSIANALRRARAGIASEKKPIGSFLFLGPTGVGKTETAKTLASVYFGSEKQMNRFDMSEYQEPDSINRLIGHEKTDGQLTNTVMDNPFSLVLLDEVEKAHPNILNLFLQVLDDGRLTDAVGRTVDFTNTIIIATSNAGSELIRQSVSQFREVNLKERLLDYLQKKGIFRPEFLNRWDAAIVFKPLSEEQTEKVVELLIADLNRRLQLQNIKVVPTPDLLKKIATSGYSPEFGARPLRRIIQDRIEAIIAKKLLAGEISRGQEVEISPEEI